MRSLAALFSPSRVSLSMMAFLVSSSALTGCGGKKEEPTTGSKADLPSSAVSTPAASTPPSSASSSAPASVSSPAPSASSPLGTASTPPPSASSAATPAAKPAGDSAAEISAAKMVFKRADEAKNFTQLADCLSNDSAVLISTNSLVQVLMLSLRPDPKKPPVKPDPATQKALQATFTNFAKKYDLEKMQKGTDADLARISQRGRTMLADLDSIVNDLQRQGKIKGNPLAEKAKGPRFGLAENYSYEAVNASTVKITPKQPAGAPSAQIRLEEGKWRLHLGDLAEMKRQSMARQQQMQQQQQMQAQPGGAPGAPPMGGGGPPLPGGTPSPAPGGSPLGGAGTPTSPLGGGTPK